MKRILFLIVLVMSASFVFASDRIDSLEISVLTCSPGTEVYSLYGHTAIRVRDFRRNGDYVFNYGVFDFNTPYFIFKFVLGQTDYLCAAIPYEYFIREYQTRGSMVTAQILNFKPDEARRCMDLLVDNVRPGNCTYRYNYLTCNCTTKVMEAVENAVDGQVAYPENTSRKTYREIIHEYTAHSPWAQEGNDVLLGAAVDTALSDRAMCFVPEYYSRALAGAVVLNDGDDTRRLVARTVILVPERKLAATYGWDEILTEPIAVGWAVFILFIVIAAVEIKMERIFLPLDIIVMFVHGIAGFMILFVFLFSQHPTLDTNWQVWVLNPLPLIALPYVVKAVWHGRTSRWHYVMSAILALFLLFMPWIPQHVCLLAVPVTLSLLSRYMTNIYIINHRSSGTDSKPTTEI